MEQESLKSVFLETPCILIDISPFYTGDTHLGGEDFDQRVMDHFIKLYKRKKGKDLRKDVRAVQKLRREFEKAKRALSESLCEGTDFSETLTRAKFEELNMNSAEGKGGHQIVLCGFCQ